MSKAATAQPAAVATNLASPAAASSAAEPAGLPGHRRPGCPSAPRMAFITGSSIVAERSGCVGAFGRMGRARRPAGASPRGSNPTLDCRDPGPSVPARGRAPRPRGRPETAYAGRSGAHAAPEGQAHGQPPGSASLAAKLLISLDIFGRWRPQRAQYCQAKSARYLVKPSKTPCHKSRT